MAVFFKPLFRLQMYNLCTAYPRKKEKCKCVIKSKKKKIKFCNFLNCISLILSVLIVRQHIFSKILDMEYSFGAN